MEMNNHIKRVALAGLVLGMAGCLGESNTIDRTQPNALDKSMFEGIWYYRAAVVDSDIESGAVEGITSNMDKIRWEIRRDMLVGYRSYEFVPYAEGLTDDGRDFFGSPVVAYAIESHFDIQRDYSTVTGVENNVIVENTVDRPWYQRQYIRVDWSRNMVGTGTQMWTGWVNYPDAFFSATSLTGFYEQGHLNPTDVNRPLITEDYFDVTNNFSLSPSPTYCWFMLLFNSVPRCGAGNAKVRLSFRKVDPNDDYESLYYPDELELRDDSGNAIIMNGDGRTCGPNRDPAECSVRTFPMDGQYGNFRILRVAFDRERAFTRTGRIYMAGRYDIWKDSYDDAGSLIPYESRQPDPIVFYNNVKLPEDMFDATQRFAEDWAVPFEETVAFLKGYTDSEGRPDLTRVQNELREQQDGLRMYQNRRNTCNPAGIVEYAQANGYVDVVNEVAGSIDLVTITNVEQVCAAIQFRELQDGKTVDPKVAARTGAAMAFTWQRKGDLRYNINNYINQYQGGPWGVAQFGQDPETGQFVANQANYFGNAGDRIAQRYVDQLQWVNGDIDQNELFRGDFTRETVVSRRSLANRSIRSVVKEQFGNVIDSFDGLPPETTAGAEGERFRRMWSGTDIEKDLLVTDDILRTFAGPDLYQPFDLGRAPLAAGAGAGAVRPGEVSYDAMEAASPVNWGMTPETNEYNMAAYELGRRAWDMADFFDPNVSGIAELVKGWDRDEIWNYLRRELFLAVQTHEVGHTLGLRHNFRASMDALNYRPEFWGEANEEGVQVQYWNNQPTENNPSNRGTEYKYASIMDYGFDVGQQGWHGIGSYDAAAIRFQYGQIMDIWDTSKVSIPDPRKYGSFARRCGHQTAAFGMDSLFFWTTPEWIPQLLAGTPVDQGPCAGNYDNDQSCDSELDQLYRELVINMESLATSPSGNPSICSVSVIDINQLFFVPESDLRDFQVMPERVYGARKFARVSDYLEQQVEILTNFPEYDLPATPDDESTNEMDDDGDGIVDDKGFDWSQAMHPVPYEYCSDRFASFSNPFCQRWDTGWDFSEQVRSHIDKFDRDYVFSNFRRDALSPWGNSRAYMSRLLARRFFHMSSVYQYYLFTRESAFLAPRWDDWEEAMYEGINFLERVIQTPEPGTYCLGADNVYRLQTDPNQACNEAYTVGLGPGQGRYLNNSWTEEYFYKANRIGDFYTKLAAIQQLTSSAGRFVRDFSDLFDRRAFALGYLRVFNDPLLQRFSALVSGDHTGYRSRVVEDESGDKFVRYMPFFDEVLEDTAGSVRQWLEEDLDSDGVEDHPEIEPAWSWSLQYYSLAWALANWSSVNDSAPEYYRMSKISIEGTPEDVIYPSTTAVQTFTDPETGIVYRAPVVPPIAEGGIRNREFPSYYGDAFMVRQGRFRNWSAGSNILAEADEFVQTEYSPARQACEATGDAEACARFRRARNGLNERIGYIDRVRKFNRRAELSFQ